MENIFKQNGYLSKVLPHYEYRDEQLQMAEFILERLYDSENGLIEAGTGIGKTLSYLAPAILYAKDNEKKISITTETKALQKQLLDKDLPIIKKVFTEHLNTDFSYCLCLGSSNYPCRKRFETAVIRGKFEASDLKHIENLKMFFDKGEIFTRFDIRTPNYLWGEINREIDACNSYKCPFSKVCSYQMARKKWSEVDVLVMNHYLFFSNIASNKTFLPPSEIVIFDEAHSLEEIASLQLGFDIGYNELIEIITLFYRDKRRNNLFGNIENESIKKKGINLINDIARKGNNFFEELRSLFKNDKFHLRIKKQLDFGIPFVDLLKEFMVYLVEIENVFNNNEIFKLEFDIARGRLFVYLEYLILFVYQSNENYVYWLEREKEEILGDIHLKGQPIDISEILRKEVISYYESSIFVSATLTVNKDFSFIINRLGIERHKSIALPSTFDYKSQMILYVARDIHDPSGEKFAEQSSAISAEIIKHLKGNCLMLFTSYKMLTEIRGVLCNMIGLPIYSQDILSSSEAVESYINGGDSVLMGTHSFWQGIDLPGDLLRGVIMMKLPFAVPDFPPVEAKIERLKKQGMNPFFSLQIPEAVIKFKQGFGRLIRSCSDKGIVAVLDSRIFTKPYGKLFISSLPECSIVYTIEDLKIGYTKLGNANQYIQLQ